MTSVEPFLQRIKPALDGFLRSPSKDSMAKLRHVLTEFDGVQMKIYHSQVLLPLVIKLEEFGDHHLELRTGVVDCIRLMISNLYLEDVNAMRMLLVIVLKQLRESGSATTKPNLSEEIKLVAVGCIKETLKRSSSDVIEKFYTKESSMIIGQILLTLVEFMEKEKFKQLVISSMQCLMVVFYVHDEADALDVVLRSQVADATFIFLPKIITILFKNCLSDEKKGETLKTAALRALWRIICITFEKSNEAVLKTTYDSSDIKKLVTDALQNEKKSNNGDADMFSSAKSKEDLQERLKRMQGDGRSATWFAATSRKLRPIFEGTSIFRSHESHGLRLEYMRMCCTLLKSCGNNLGDNFIILVEGAITMSEDAVDLISYRCSSMLKKLQGGNNKSIFDETAELLFEQHMTKLPRIIHRCDDAEQYAELLFLKCFMNSIGKDRLKLLFSVPKNMEVICMCLLSALEFRTTRALLVEEYALRSIDEATDFLGPNKLHWRQFKHLGSDRCVGMIEQIYFLLGDTQVVNRLVIDYLLELLQSENESMNEIILAMTWVTIACCDEDNRSVMMGILLDELCKDTHWQLALEPDHVFRLKVDKPSAWYVDRTPGLYESAIEIRTQDCDSDDDGVDVGCANKNRVTIMDAQFNVLHTCIVMDALAHCAIYDGKAFERHIFRCLHRVLLKVASSNSMVHQAASFALVSMQKALHFQKLSNFLDSYADYITYHLNTILRRSPESKSAVDILSVVLQHSTLDALPHMESIFQTICEECAKSYQSENINSYLKVFNAFCTHIQSLQRTCDAELDKIPMQVDVEQETDLVENWLNIVQQPKNVEADDVPMDSNNLGATHEEPQPNEAPEEGDGKPKLLRHLQMIKDIANQVVKLISSSKKMSQILALECLVSALPLLKDYENDLLPLVHLIWRPLVEKFRQKDPVVLNRCFSLLNVLATCAKDFILKRSLSDIIPHLEKFLKETAAHSAGKVITAQTQEYKLQCKLLQDFANLIQSTGIDGRNLNDIAEVVALYTSNKQPKELQALAVAFFAQLRLYNGPLTYLVMVKKWQIVCYKENAESILSEFVSE